MKQLKLNMLLAVLMLCICTALSAASYEPFSQVTITDGIYQQGGTVTPNVNQEATLFGETANYSTDITTQAPGDPNSWEDFDNKNQGTGNVGTPLNGGYFFLIAMALGLAGLRVRKALCEE